MTRQTNENQTRLEGIGRGAIGVFQSDGKYLLIRRAAGVTRPGTWCFPGGHLEPGETTRRAVVREMWEELNVRVEAHQKLGFVRIVEVGYILAAWRVRMISGTLSPNPSEIAEARWLGPKQVREVHPSLESNEIVFRMLGI